MRKLSVILLACVTVVVWLLCAPQAMAKVTGPCSDCHTMHNSQNGTDVVSGGPYQALTKGDCIGCHTGTNDGTNNIPYVLQTSAPTYTFDGTKSTLAGGSFYWVDDSGGADDAKGHNVSGIVDADTNIGQTPPGFNSSDYTANGAVGTAWASNQLTCAGTYGCHGDHTKSGNFEAISGAHHADDSTIDGSTVGKSFRFLYGIKGTEDSDWEYAASSSDHNGYWASDYNNGPGSMDSASINYLCAECHGNFHLHAQIDDSTNGSPWLRHPTDYDMNNVSSKEYGSYPNTIYSSVSAAGDYFVDVPVGSTTGAVNSKVLQASGDAIVLCVSCHRAHGSPYADLLRWDYSTCDAGQTTQSSDCGCFACHTGK